MKTGNQKKYMHQPASDLDYVEELSAYIERHLGKSLDAGMLADLGFVSRGKLYRDFLNATGHPVREYIRKRRLSNALTLLRSSDLPPASIAYECGYSSQQAMCRSIHASLGMTPGQYRQSDSCYFFPPYRGGAIYDISVRRLSLPTLYGIQFFHRSLTGIENRALALLFERVPDFSGRLFGKNGRQRGALFCYELYV
ncbi:MAG: AraC family transcriptional regulator, partial [Lachnospiraceae bacterium]|nr:AraC family transcriptional regulator [Lachnospiraceae bacterium]